jgi:putative oxidoreductase
MLGRADPQGRPSTVKNARTVIRFLLALALAVFGADKFLHFMPQPDAPPEGGAFLGALFDAGYVFPAIGLAFLTTSACLLAGRVALGVIILTPITLNILLYHFRYDMAGIGPGAVIAALQVALIWMHRSELAALLARGRATRA